MFYSETFFHIVHYMRKIQPNRFILFCVTNRKTHIVYRHHSMFIYKNAYDFRCSTEREVLLET